MRGCPACGEAASFSSFALAGGDEMRRCAACGSLFPQAPPSAWESYADYYTAAPRRPAWRRLASRIAEASRRNYLDRHLPHDSDCVLDFGCGAGEFLERIARPGRRLFGVEPVSPVRRARSWTLLADGEIEAQAPYDWITLGHVLEHLDEPSGVLRRLAATLAEGGGLWIATPNAESFLIHGAGALARDIDYPRHRQIFTRAGLERLAAANGLAIEFQDPPTLNAVLNSATTARIIIGERSLTLPVRLGIASRVLAPLAGHLVGFGPGRRRGSPELVAICRPLPSQSAAP